MPSGAVTKMIAVYRKRQSTRSLPYCLIPLEEAQDWVTAGLAKTCNKGKSVQLVAEEELKLRDLSCQMGPRIIEANAEGKSWAQIITEAWAHTSAIY